MKRVQAKGWAFHEKVETTSTVVILRKDCQPLVRCYIHSHNNDKSSVHIYCYPFHSADLSLIPADGGRRTAGAHRYGPNKGKLYFYGELLGEGRETGIFDAWDQPLRPGAARR